ncbi:MAG: methyltransferase domain-containing protein [Opitutaceae bacterium]
MAIQNHQLIQHYKEIHQTSSFGATASNFALQIRLCMQELQPNTVLEYGCGKSNLIEICSNDSLKWDRYDPAMPDFSERPEGQYDLIVNTDVMEHIPTSDVDDVLEDIRRSGDKVFFNISTRLAGKVLPDGTNAHCTVQNADAWLTAINKHFPDSEIAYIDEGEDTIITTWPSCYAYAIQGIGELRRALRLQRKNKKRRGLRKLVWKIKQKRKSKSAENL